jgi:hypothetical protein
MRKEESAKNREGKEEREMKYRNRERTPKTIRPIQLNRSQQGQYRHFACSHITYQSNCTKV